MGPISGIGQKVMKVLQKQGLAPLCALLVWKEACDWTPHIVFPF